MTADVPSAGQWTVRWLSKPRLGPYLRACGNDLDRALQLYEWNASVSAALLHDLGHLEVAIRNAYDRAITTHWTGPGHWTSQGSRLLAPTMRRRGRERVDVNRKRRDELAGAIAKAGGPHAPPGKVVAELMFGFWRYLTSRACEKSLWVPYLHHAFPPGTDRHRDADQPIGRIHELRNRVVHHEPLLGADLAGRQADLLALARLLDPQLHDFVRATSTVSHLLGERPGS